MSIQAYAREKGYVHLLWIIFFQVLVISGLLLLTPNGNTIASYISFASSIASLILAVVAIFYSIISNQSFYQYIGTLQSLAERIQQESGSINSNLNAFSDKAESLVSTISCIPGSVDRLERTLTDKLNTISPVREVKGGKKDGGSFLPRTTVGANVAVYLIARAASLGKTFDTKELFEDPVMKNYVTAVVTTLAFIGYRGLNVKVDQYKFEVIDTGEMDVGEIIEKAHSTKVELIKKAVTQIDEYFEASGPDSERNAEGGQS